MGITSFLSFWELKYTQRKLNAGSSREFFILYTERFNCFQYCFWGYSMAVFRSIPQKVLSVLLISWEYSIHPKGILWFYFKVFVLPKTTVKALQYFIYLQHKVPFSLNLMSRFSEGQNSNRTNKFKNFWTCRSGIYCICVKRINALQLPVFFFSFFSFSWLCQRHQD